MNSERIVGICFFSVFGLLLFPLLLICWWILRVDYNLSKGGGVKF